MRRKSIPLAQAVGRPLAHDLTRIVPGRVKETAFKKGQVIEESDLEALRDMGRESLYILELADDEVHENDAAVELARLAAGQGLEASRPAEGKVNLYATGPGLLKIHVRGTARLNAIAELTLSTLHTNTICEPGQLVASVKVVPLAVRRRSLDRARALVERVGPLVELRPFRPRKVGAVVTGNEVVEGRVSDGFDQFVAPRIRRFGAEIVSKAVVNDEPKAIARAIQDQIAAGAELLVVTGGLSVDPDDRTRQGVRLAGARQVFYGTPVLPGAMFLYARLNEVPILGVPACVYYNHRTVFDLVLPRVLADNHITRAEICALGHGGLCQLCETCSFPHCPFGKGGV